MSRMAARWVLRNIYEQPDLEVQQHFEPRFVQRESSARPAR